MLVKLLLFFRNLQALRKVLNVTKWFIDSTSVFAHPSDKMDFCIWIVTMQVHIWWDRIFIGFSAWRQIFICFVWPTKPVQSISRIFREIDSLELLCVLVYIYKQFSTFFYKSYMRFFFLKFQLHNYSQNNSCRNWPYLK